MFKDKILVITGGTGSFGYAVLSRFLFSDIAEIRVLSRDEKKQDDLRKQFKSEKLKFYIGDVRDIRSLDQAFRGADFCFHAAALKQVPSCEFFPIEAVKTNILGTENVLETAIKNNLSKVLCLSTDKAVYPVNAMGISKAMMEKVMVASSRNINNKNTIICGTRYGNVIGSRGSVIPLFIHQILNNLPITITDPNMTRFMMTMSDAVDLVIYAFKNGNNGEIFVQKAPSVTIGILVDSLIRLSNSKSKDYQIDIIGTRHGEKLFEALMTREEFTKAEEFDRYYRIRPDLRDLNYAKYVELGEIKISESKEYNSHNTKRLNIDEMCDLLTTLPLIQDFQLGKLSMDTI